MMPSMVLFVQFLHSHCHLYIIFSILAIYNLYYLTISSTLIYVHKPVKPNNYYTSCVGMAIGSG